jgi:transcriptional regulator with XRE-family HTH domain
MARRDPPPRRPSKITVPERCHPMAKVVFALMRDQSVTYDELEARAGVLRSTIKAWRTSNRPGLETIEAALGALGWSVLPVPPIGQLPLAVQQGLKALSAQWTDENALLTGLLATVCRTAIAVRDAAPDAPIIVTMAKRRGRPVHPDQVPLFEGAANA